LASEDTIVEILTSPDQLERVLIIRRADGLATYRRQWSAPGGWGASGPDAGLYDTAAMAEAEARARVTWLLP
jgi:ADP-ribose pyrophosphatase YjhB (NUDIX family)